MRHVVHPKLVGIITVMAFAIAVMVLGFAHKAPQARDNQIQAAALQGYDISDICAGDLGDIHSSSSCPACNPDNGGVMPDPVGLVWNADFQFARSVIAPRESRAVRAVRDPALGLRGPPRL